MKKSTLREITMGQDWVGLGIAGNQAEHLIQAGEADDFKGVKSTGNAPKGLFPWFIKGSNSFLRVEPLSSDLLNYHAEGLLQPEPEVCLVVRFHYSETEGQLLKGLTVVGFSAFNDCSRRVNAPKISLKKNWGEASQGMAATLLPLHDFSKIGGFIDHFRIACYLKRDGKLHQYGKDTAVVDYCYFNQELVDWMVSQINNQHDHGPLESIRDLLSPTKPAFGVIGIGATCYTDFGNSEDRFLRVGDTVTVCLYDERMHDKKGLELILSKPLEEDVNDCTLIVLQQEVVAG